VSQGDTARDKSADEYTVVSSATVRARDDTREFCERFDYK